MPMQAAPKFVRIWRGGSKLDIQADWPVRALLIDLVDSSRMRLAFLRIARQGGIS